ncbi:sulfur carrier protein ThiS [Hyphomicrobium methylovorum]|uniref:sulfur carrier protein ThiS n=1 Tax=Hyphomicrobium methylovorum TaxID=84 RepID=UPI001FE4BEB2|nr:sulfur carrier protein ThiS [Hyphomicrobium methylovorum]
MAKIEILINGRQTGTAARTLEALVKDHAAGDLRVATALNGHFVPVARRATTPIEAGDSVEIVSARQGG